MEKIISVRVDPDFHKEFKADAKNNRRSIAGHAEYILKEHLDGRERTADMDRILEGQGK